VLFDLWTFLTNQELAWLWPFVLVSFINRKTDVLMNGWMDWPSGIQTNRWTDRCGGHSSVLK
jgi:hypothetical protein